MSIKGIAKQIAQARARGGGNFVNPGRGVLIVKALKDGTKPEFYAGDTFVAELLVEKSEGFPGMKDYEGKDKPAGNAVGSTVSYVQQYEEFPDTAFSNTKSFLLELLGETEETLIVAAGVTQARMNSDPAVKQEMELFKARSDITPADGVPAGGWNADCEFALAYDKLVDRKTNPARGMRIAYNTFEKPTRESHKILTLPVWEHVAQTGDQIKATRAQLDGAPPTAG